MKIVFCIPGNLFSGVFFDCWTSTVVYCVQNGINFEVMRRYDGNIYLSRNKCLGSVPQNGIDQKPFQGLFDYDYMLWIDSDMAWHPQNIQKLINHQVDIVAAAYKTASQLEYAFCIEKKNEDFEKEGRHHLFTVEEEQDKDFLIKLEDKFDKNGLLEVDYFGFGFVLIKKGIIEQLKYPWFRPRLDGKNGFEDLVTEDGNMCDSIKELGYKLKVDLTVKVGHEKRLIIQ